MLRKRRFLSVLLSLVLILGTIPITAMAEQTESEGTGLCEHHPQHTDECGYTVGSEGTPCSHEHTGDCYTLVTSCVHEHTDECYPAESVSGNTATPSETEEQEPTECTHVCSEESGCITEVLDCKHEHKVNGGLGRDEACGYTPATQGTPCTYVCEICNPQDSGETGGAGTEEEPAAPGSAIDSAVTDVQAMIDALPTTEELERMSQDEQGTVYEQVQAAYDAYKALTDEQKGQITGAEVINAFFDVFNSMTNVLATVGSFNVEGGTSGTDYSYSGGVLTINNGANLTISTNGQTRERIVVAANATATITLNNVNIKGSDGDSSNDAQSAIDIGAGASLTLILANGSDSTLAGGDRSDSRGAPGIRLPTGASLTIRGNGTLTVNGGTGSTGGTGIGGTSPSSGNGEGCGSVTIEGGTVHVNGGTGTSGPGGAGIGGGCGGFGGAGGSGGYVIISGGSVNVTGGTSNAVGNAGGAGIGGGVAGAGLVAGGEGGTVTITGGSVTVTGGNGDRGGAGIGGGVSSNGSGGVGAIVTITGGGVTVTGGNGTVSGGIGGAGIGGGSGVSGGGGGTVFILVDAEVDGGTGGATTGQAGNNIGGGQGISSTGGNGQGIRPSSSGSNTYDVYGNLTLLDGVTLPGGITINIPDGASLTLPKGASWPDNVTITGNGSIDPKLTATITISANLDKTHDGSAVSLDSSGYTYTGDTTTPTITITWHEDNSGKIGNALTSAPSATGIYWVKVSAAETNWYAAAEATKQFTISQPLDAPMGLAWDGNTPGRATWSAVTNASGYSVQLYKDGTAQGSPVTINSGSTTSYDFQITQAGRYTFTVTATGNGAYSDSSASAQSAALYTVSFDMNGGTGTIPMQLVPNGGTATEPTTAPTRTGYDFMGWYKDSALSMAWNFDTDTVTAATTLYAKWTASTYTVTLETNGGTVNNDNVTKYTYGVGATLPTDVTREGYAFAGWYDNEALSGTWVTAITDTDTGDKTYYAKWLSTNAGITSVSVSGTTGTVNGTQISVVLPAATASLPTDSTEVSITLADRNAQVSALATTDNGSTWTFTVTAEDGTTAASYTINVAVQISGTVAISGTPVCGQALTAAYEGNAGRVTWQWYRDNTEIDGATKTSYTLTVGDVGHQIHVIATAADKIHTGFVTSDSTTAVGPTYTVTIPEKVELGGTVTISADGVNVAADHQLEVALTGTSGDNDAFTLNTTEGADVAYTVTNESGQPVKVNDTILTVTGGTANSNGSAELSFALASDDIVKYSGTYTGRVTFTVRLAPQSGSGN